MVQLLDAAAPSGTLPVPVDPLLSIWPAAPQSVTATGLSPMFLEELAIKVIHYAGPSTLEHIGRRLGLAVPVVEEIADNLRSSGMVEPLGLSDFSGQQYSTLGYKFALSGRGEQRAANALSRSRYAGLAPVVLSQYVALAMSQSLRETPASAEQIEGSMAPFVLEPAVKMALARAFHAGRPALIYGESGNGKTALVDAYARSFGENVLIPSALYVNGQTIRIFDEAVHRRAGISMAGTPAKPVSSDGILRYTGNTYDHRWLAVRRPVVMVGGELTLETLDLAFDETGGFYSAPPQLKAQDGIFIIDDFGRQLVRPDELLNRWILPLESGYDMLMLKSGERLTVPFEASILFSSNLRPSDLADEAFLRRIPYKVKLLNPGEEQIAEISRRECRRMEVAFDEAGIEALVRAIFQPGRPSPKAVYPRDLLTIMEDGARYTNRPAELTVDAIHDACQIYFVAEGS